MKRKHQEAGPSGITPRMANPPDRRTRQTPHIPLLQTPGQPPHLHRYGLDGIDSTNTRTTPINTTTRRTLLPTPAEYTQTLTITPTHTTKTTTTKYHTPKPTTTSTQPTTHKPPITTTTRRTLLPTLAKYTQTLTIAPTHTTPTTTT
ncbi:salivary glue protein Sgs-3-like [Diprion similis]|uniref:salivary glue protein Sgs-3-like n=1 Tax=Diprion similis TaxID=362088 RepID=UPI001EF98704|nr:salivary glue protein Sgs-3-like [Diprion similis]